MTDTELHRLSELRSLLEGFAARHAASHATPEARQPGPLHSILKRLNAAVRQRDYRGFREADAQLHSTVVAAAAVPLLREVWQVVWTGLQAFHQKGFEDCFPDARVLIEEHAHLVETITSGDPAADYPQLARFAANPLPMMALAPDAKAALAGEALASLKACAAAEAQGLQWSIVIFAGGYGWAALHYLLAGRTLQADMIVNAAPAKG